MNISYQDLTSGKGKFNVTLEAQELESATKHAMTHYQHSLEVKGFRKGKIPESVILQRVGEMQLAQEAIEEMLPDIIDRGMKENKIDIYGQPDVKILKLVPKEIAELEINFTRIPAVTLKTHEGLSLAKKPIKISEDEIKKSLTELQNLYATESKTENAAKKGDRVIVSFEGFLDSVPLEGAKAKKHPMILGEAMFVPGFEDQLVGLKANEKKTFTVRFPKAYHQKNIADKEVKFNVEVHEVLERKLPELTDEWAKKLGTFTKIDDLKKQLNENLKHEAEHKEDERFEQDMLQKLITQNGFEPIPLEMLSDEKERMVEELAQSVTKNGGRFEDYLASIKKTKEQIMQDFTPRAEERIKSALLLRHLANEYNLGATDDEVSARINHDKERYANEPKAAEQISSPQYKRHIANVLTSTKVLSFLKEKNEAK